SVTVACAPSPRGRGDHAVMLCPAQPTLLSHNMGKGRHGCRATRGVSVKRTAVWSVVLALVALALRWFPASLSGTAAESPDPGNTLIGVENKRMNLGNFPLEGGQLLPEVTIAYETYGQLARDGRNAILITHGYTSNHHAAGRYATPNAKPGWWDRLIGPG